MESFIKTLLKFKKKREAEDRFKEILCTIPKYGKNEITTERYCGYLDEIQSLTR